MKTTALLLSLFFPALAWGQTQAGNWDLSPWHYNGQTISTSTLTSDGQVPVGITGSVSSQGSELDGVNDGSASVETNLHVPANATMSINWTETYQLSAAVNFGAVASQWQFTTDPSIAPNNGISIKLAFNNAFNLITSYDLDITITGGGVFSSSGTTSTGTVTSSGQGTSTYHVTWTPNAGAAQVFYFQPLGIDGPVSSVTFSHTVHCINFQSSSVDLPDSTTFRINNLTAAATPAPTAPTIAVTGKKTIHTAQAKCTIKGQATGTVTSVTYQLGKKTGTAKGTTAWKIQPRLAPGKNKILITAHGPGGDSTPVKITVTRLIGEL